MRLQTSLATTQVPCLNGEGSLLAGSASIQGSPTMIPVPTTINSATIPMRRPMAVPSVMLIFSRAPARPRRTPVPDCHACTFHSRRDPIPCELDRSAPARDAPCTSASHKATRSNTAPPIIEASNTGESLAITTCTSVTITAPTISALLIVRSFSVSVGSEASTGSEIARPLLLAK